MDLYIRKEAAWRIGDKVFWNHRAAADYAEELAYESIKKILAPLGLFEKDVYKIGVALIAAKAQIANVLSIEVEK